MAAKWVKLGEQLDMFGSDAGVAASGGETRFVGEGPLPGPRGDAGAADVGVALPTPVVAAEMVGELPAVVVGGGQAIQDAGEELVYNRRNRVRTGKRWGDVSSLNDALKVKESVKGNVWPKPDYKQLVADGMPPMVAHIVKQAYDSVAVKPVIGGREVLNDISLQRYFEAISRVESGVMQWAQDSDAVQQWAAANARIAGAMRGKQVAVSSLVGSEDKTLMGAVYPEGWKAYRNEVLIAGGNKLLGALQPGYDEIRRAIKAVEKGWPEKREAWEIQGFRVVENPEVEVRENSQHEGSFILSVDKRYVQSFGTIAEAQTAAAGIKPFVLYGKRGMVDSFASEEEAIEGAKDRARREKGNVIGEKGVRVEAVERVGVSRRMEGEDISSERLVAEFGFKGVNFGNWMKTPAARAEAQLHLNHAFDSAHDLAEILGVPPTAISLNGMLGLAIGAQGSGSFAAAHFMPGVNEINITRTSGAGSLAHEWGHALDHYFAAQGGLATAAEPFLTVHASLGAMKSAGKTVDGKLVASDVPRFGNLRPEIVTAFGAVVEAMNLRPQTVEEARAVDVDRLAKARSSVDGWLKGIRRDFVGQEEAFDVLAARVRAGDVGDGMVAVSRNTYLSPVVVEMRNLYKAKHGRVYSIENSKGLQAWVNIVGVRTAKIATEADHVPQGVPTDFAKKAQLQDKEKGGKPYWGTTVEKFARAFDAFVSDELEAREAKNSYLSHAGRVGWTVPAGAERETINGAFRALVGAVKTRETDRGVALFSQVGGEASQGLAVAVIEAEVLRMRDEWPAMPGVTVVGSVKELPFDAPENADGAYYDGHVFVVAGNVDDLKQFQKVMAHECVLHHGLQEMLGYYGFSKLHSGIQALKKAGDPVVSSLAAEIRARYGVLAPETETREIIARAGEQCLDETGNVKVGFGFMKSVYAGVAGWLRDQGFKVPFTNIELQGILHDSGKWIQKDRGLGDDKGVQPSSSDVLNSFAGVRAANAPVDDSNRWFVGVDGERRFEIGDMNARLTMDNLGKGDLADLAKGHAVGLGLGRLLDHAELFAAYPELKVLRVLIDPDTKGGSYESGIRVIRVGYNKETGEANLSSLMHEIQHVIQERERFAMGGSPAQFKKVDVSHKERERLNEEVHKLYSANQEFYRDSVKATQLQIAVLEKYGTTDCDPGDSLVQEWWKAIDTRDAHPEASEWFSLKSEQYYLEKNPIVLLPEEQYRRLSGEVEARLTQSRMGMSMEQRFACPPLDMMDTPAGNQILHYGMAPKFDVVKEGTFCGKVLDVADGVVVQKTGREADKLARHDALRLSRVPAIDDVVDIKYRDGMGEVSGKGKETGKGR